MTRGHFRHWPVSGDSGLAGIIDITDICRALIGPDIPGGPAPTRPRPGWSDTGHERTAAPAASLTWDKPSRATAVGR